MNQKVKSHKGVFMQSIRSRVIVMGILSVILAAIIGFVGIMAVNNNMRNSDVESAAYEIDMLRSQNQEFEALYQYHVSQEYLDNIIANYDKMLELAVQLEKTATGTNKQSVQEIQTIATEAKSNYGKIKELHNSRGFDSSLVHIASM